jgi:hypothetical protein
VDPIDSAEQITQYLILISNQDYIKFEEIPEYCDGSDPVVLEQLYCEVPIALFKQMPFEYLSGGRVRAQFRARNANGWGPYSELTLSGTGALIQEVPNKMAAPTRDDLTTTLRLVLNWLPLTTEEAGYADVNSYWLQWDEGLGGSDQWFNLIGYETDSLVTTFQIV